MGTFHGITIHIYSTECVCTSQTENSLENKVEIRLELVKWNGYRSVVVAGHSATDDDAVEVRAARGLNNIIKRERETLWEMI